MNDRKLLSEKLVELQRQRGVASGRDYWQCLEELADTASFQELMRQEFPTLADVWPDELSRRKFMYLMGASLAFAGIGGCSVRPAPQGTVVPYVRSPEEIIPGEPLYFATTMVHDGDAVGLLVESHEGRPTKIEGNPDHPASLGATNIFHQASVLTMYDPARSQTVLQGDRISGWDDADAAIAAAIAPALKKQGRGLRLLTETVLSPTLGQQIEQLLERYPQAKWHQYEPITNLGGMHASQIAFGNDSAAVYDFQQADVVLSLDADFLAAGPGHLRYANQFIKRRRVRTTIADAQTAQMNRLYVVETAVSCTGAKADHRLALRMTDIEIVARNIAAELGVSGVTGGGGSRSDWTAAVARDLKAHAGRCIILAGHRQSSAVHLLTHAMNDALGNQGKTIHYIKPVEVRPVDPFVSLHDLVNDMNRKEVDALMILGGNPVYSAPVDFSFAESLRLVPQTFHLSLYENETSRLCSWHLPEAHYLEAWSDARAFDGTASIVQPLIAPLYRGRSAHELVAGLNGEQGARGLEIVRSYWRQQRKQMGYGEDTFDDFWETALHDGRIRNTAAPTVAVELRDGWQSHIANDSKASASPKSENFELVIDADPTIFDGRYASNGWLQELPKSFTKLTWDNAAIVSPNTAHELGLQYESFAHGGEHGGYQVPMIALQINDRRVEAPVWIMPGHADAAVTVYLGHGRKYAGRVHGVWQQTPGFDAYKLRTSDHPWFASALNIASLDASYPLACTQAHFLMNDRDIIRSTTLSDYREDPRRVAARKKVGREKLAEPEEPPMTMYKPFDYEPPQRKWGMSIDTTSCIGCNACVVACQAENNIPVVGKEQVLMGREMHWLRVDRYLHGDPAQPDEFYFQPVPCMQCEHAPCEYVCPVEATVHSAEGLNDMIYNRCVGTRFCSNNCPYKVRRFNFLQYSDFETVPLRLQYNPDVTVRSRGVMEKCTYCVQRIRHAEITAESGRRPIRDGEVLTACQSACPTQAIVFGDMNDPASRICAEKNSPLDYALLAELNTYPRTTYLAALRNPNHELVT